MVGSYTETVGKWFTESKEKGEGETKRTRANELDPK